VINQSQLLLYSSMFWCVSGCSKVSPAQGQQTHSWALAECWGGAKAEFFSAALCSKPRLPKSIGESHGAACLLGTKAGS